jgi:hypothetical protein
MNQEMVNGEYILTIKDKNAQNIPLRLSPEEGKIVQNNPEAEKNIENMYFFFKNLNLESVWTHRHEIISACHDPLIQLNDKFMTQGQLILMSKKILLFLNKTQEQRKDNTAYDLNSKTKIDIENQFKSYT